MKYAYDLIYDAASQLWPAKMIQIESRALMLAVGLQTSRFEHRRQVQGAGRGFWGFDQSGAIHSVLQHPSTRGAIRYVLDKLRYDDSSWTSYVACESNDILAMSFARMLLWIVPGPLPVRGAHQAAWIYYCNAFLPTAVNRETWNAFYDEAWSYVL